MPAASLLAALVQLPQEGSAQQQCRSKGHVSKETGTAHHIPPVRNAPEQAPSAVPSNHRPVPCQIFFEASHHTPLTDCAQMLRSAATSKVSRAWSEEWLQTRHPHTVCCTSLPSGSSTAVQDFKLSHSSSPAPWLPAPPHPMSGCGSSTHRLQQSQGSSPAPWLPESAPPAPGAAPWFGCCPATYAG